MFYFITNQAVVPLIVKPYDREEKHLMILIRKKHMGFDFIGNEKRTANIMKISNSQLKQEKNEIKTKSINCVLIP